jgi:GT2 family glycosyltransferase
MNGDISVVIPAYNRAELIGETLRSLLNQTVPAKEIIVVDDGSTDGTAESVEREWRVASKELSVKGREVPELRVIRQENAGPGAARNRGLAASTGEFIHFFDSDDIAAPNKHEVQLRALQESGADIAYGAWVKGRFIEDERHFSGKVERLEGGKVGAESARQREAEPRATWEDGKVEVEGGESSVASEAAVTHYPLPVTPYARFEPIGPILQAHGLPHGDLVKALLTDWSIVPHACLFRRSIVERIGGFPDDMTGAEDQMMFLRCLLAGAKVVHSPGTIEFYRLGDAGKLTAQGDAQKRMARDWARYLVRAHDEVTSGEWRVKSGARPEVAGQGSKGQRDEGGREGSELAENEGNKGPRDQRTKGQPEVGGRSEPATRDSLPVTTAPSAWFGFRLRAYEAWRDLEKFFPGSEFDLKKNLEQLFLPNPKHQSSELLIYRLAGWWVRKVAGIKGLLTGSRVRRCFRAGKYGPKEEALFCSAMRQVPR